jgi:hypothetical protein
MMDPILTKERNYNLWQSGAFGSKLRSWRSVEEWRKSGFDGLIVLRRLVAGAANCKYNLQSDQVDGVVAEWIASGATIDSIMVNEAAPDGDHIMLQGEYFNDAFGDGHVATIPGYFLYSKVHQQMRLALREESSHACGLRADLLLRGCMTPSSYEDFRAILELYPRHVVEVSIYDCCVGDVPGRNALVWEVRRY